MRTGHKCDCRGCFKRAEKNWTYGSKYFCTRSCRNICWIESNLRVPEGKLVGQPVQIRTFQRRIFQGLYDSPTRTLIVTFGRKNAKTSKAAFILLLHLCGPEARPNSDLHSTALSRDQAAILYKLAAKIIRLSPTIRDKVHTRDTKKELVCPDFGTFYGALSADASVNLGLSPVLVVHDELGAVRGPEHDLYDAVETAVAAQEEPISIIISTQAATDNDLLSVLIDDAEEGHDPEIKLFMYTANPDDDPFDVETIRQANPAFDEFQNQKEVLRMAENARRMPSRENQYRNKVLNQRVESFSPFVSKKVWQGNGEDPEEFGKVYAGLDLSQSTDLTAMVLGSPVRGQIHVKPFFWLPEEGLQARSREDRVPYDIWAKEGFLETTPGASIEYEYVAKRIIWMFDTYDIRKVAFDRSYMRQLKPWILKEGMSEAKFDETFVDYGQGFVSMGKAVRELDAKLANHKIRHGNHPVLTMCATNAVVKVDEAGNRKLDKKRSTGRIDGLVSMAMMAAMIAEDAHSLPVFSVPEKNIVENLTR